MVATNLLTRENAAERLGVSVQHLTRIRDFEGLTYKMQGSRVFYTKASIQKLAKARKKK